MVHAAGAAHTGCIAPPPKEPAMTSFQLPDLGRLLGRPAPAARRRRTRPPEWFDGKPPTVVDDGCEGFDGFASSAELARGLVVIEGDARCPGAT
jgi:hypothetical protein